MHTNPIELDDTFLTKSSSAQAASKKDINVVSDTYSTVLHSDILMDFSKVLEATVTLHV